MSLGYKGFMFILFFNRIILYVTPKPPKLRKIEC